MTSPKPHLLLIDDDPNTLASLSRAFRLAGYEATVCDSAARALELIRAERFDVIFSDVVMPGKDGISLLEDLKATGVTTPVVMISGQASVEIAVTRHAARRRGFSRKAALHGKTSGHHRKCFATAPPRRRKPRPCAGVWASTKSSGPGPSWNGCWRRWSASPRANLASRFRAKPAPARNSSRAPFIRRARGVPGRS